MLQVKYMPHSQLISNNTDLIIIKTFWRGPNFLTTFGSEWLVKLIGWALKRNTNWECTVY